MSFDATLKSSHPPTSGDAKRPTSPARGVLVAGLIVLALLGGIEGSSAARAGRNGADGGLNASGVASTLTPTITPTRRPTTTPIATQSDDAVTYQINAGHTGAISTSLNLPLRVI